MSDKRKRRASAPYRRDYLRGQAELSKVQGDAKHLADETVQSTRRMIRLVNECQDAGIQTITLLNLQDEQLRRAEQNLDHINSTLTQAQNNLGKLEYGEELKERDNCCYNVCYFCCKCYKCRFIDGKTKKRHGVIQNAPAPAVPMPISVVQKPMEPVKLTKKQLQDQKQKPGFVGRIRNDANEDEMENNLQAVSSVIGNLKLVAVDTGTTLTRSNKQIDRLNEKATKDQSKLADARARTEKLLKR